MGSALAAVESRGSVSALQRARARIDEIGTRGLAIAGGVVVVLSIVFIAMDGPKLFWKRFLDGLANGFVYGAVALALVLIYKATSIINFAQGSMAMFFTFVSWVLANEQGWPVWLSIVTAMVASALFAAGIERVLIRPFDPANHLPITIITIALLSVIDGLAVYIWFSDPKGYPSPFPSTKDDVITIWGARVFYAQIGIWLTVIITTIVLSLLLSKTRIGLAFRAVSSNLESSRLVGVHVGRTLQFGWALAAGIGTLAGSMFLSSGTTQLQPLFMGQILVFSFAAATIGGLDSLVGAVVGGLLVAQLQTMIGGYIKFIGSDLVLATTLVLIIVVLLVRPNGLFGSKRVERV